MSIWHLNEIDWLRRLSEVDRAQLENRSRAEAFSASETVFRPSTEPRFVYLLQSGRVRIFRASADGAETTFGYVLPGEVFGELAAVTHQERESYAEAVEESVVWKLPVDVFRELLGSQLDVASEVARQVGSRMKDLERRVEGLVFDDARKRLCRILLELADHFGTLREDGIHIENIFTQTELANLVGCSRQTVNQSLGVLTERGLARIDGRRIILPDPEQLRAALVSGSWPEPA
ncbi:MAG: Crp/Fnr family transcriptional regulator [bacterium]|nr:Crp/Fnr family transcriptional regulator [bacterium]MCP5071239.1 Crp/Fnr family transcriptional regulator [bacterium]